MVVQDIMMSGAPKIPEERAKVKRLNHMHVANRFRYSLRVSSKHKIYIRDLHLFFWND